MLVFLSDAFMEDKDCLNLFLHAKNVMNKPWQVSCMLNVYVIVTSLRRYVVCD